MPTKKSSGAVGLKSTDFVTVRTKTEDVIVSVTTMASGREIVKGLPVGVARRDVLAIIRKATKDIAEIGNIPESMMRS